MGVFEVTRRGTVFISALLLSTLLSQQATADSPARPATPPVECWLENQTPSVAVGTWAGYVVHASGGTGTFSVVFTYGDGQSDQATQSSESIPFGHVFSSPGNFVQTATVSAPGSQTYCQTSTNVY
jgi:hypothetical protein